MDTIWTAVAVAAVGAAVVAVIFAVLQREKARAATERLRETAAELERTRGEFDGLRRSHTNLEKELAGERAGREAEHEAFEVSRKKLNADFENLANRIFDESSRKFADNNREKISQLLNPFKDQLSEFRKKVEDVQVKESKDWATLVAEITSLKSLNRRISEDAVNLTNALKGDKKLMGTWGEQALERILEMSGLEEGREFERQVSDRTDDGRTGRPDVVVHMADGRDMVIDAKVSLVAYERHYSAEDEDEKKAALKEHIASIRRHIDGLSGKRYEDLSGIRSPGFVLMFVPIEAAFSLALKNDPGLLDFAMSKKVVLVSPTSLLSSLRTIAFVWRYELQTRNAKEIARAAGNLYDKFVGFVDTLAGVRKHIHTAADTCDQAIGQLATGRGNLVGRVEGLRRLGVKGKKDFPRELIDRAGATDPELPGPEENGDPRPAQPAKPEPGS